MLANHALPEIGRHAPAVAAAGEFIITGFANQLGYKSIGMLGAHIEIPLTERVEHGVVIEIFGKFLETFVACNGIKIEKRLVHSAELIAEHQATCLLGLTDEFSVSPVAHFGCHFKCLSIAGIKILVNQSGHYFVQCVPRCPYAFPLEGPVDKFLRESAEIARRAKCLLHLGQPGHDGVALEFEHIGTCGGIHQSVGRHKVAGGMAAKIAIKRFPTTKLLYTLISTFQSGKYAGIIAEAMEQPVHRNISHPGRIALEIMAHTARQQRHFAEIEALRFACYPVFNFEFSRVLPGNHGLRPCAGNTKSGCTASRQNFSVY